MVIPSQLSKSGKHDRTPVTTKHEKRLYANPLFAVSYSSFQRRPFRSWRGFERNRDVSTVIRGTASVDAPYTRCDHLQQMTIGVAEVKRLSAIFPSLP